MHNNEKDQWYTFDLRANEGVFIGYSAISKAYWIYKKRTLVVEESPHMVFDESYEQINKKNTTDVIDKMSDKVKKKEWIRIQLMEHFRIRAVDSELEEEKNHLTKRDKTSAVHQQDD